MNAFVVRRQGGVRELKIARTSRKRVLTKIEKRTSLPCLNFPKPLSSFQDSYTDLDHEGLCGCGETDRPLCAAHHVALSQSRVKKHRHTVLLGAEEL